MHILRNFADHGIESPEIRQAQGKPEKGLIKLSAYEVFAIPLVPVIEAVRVCPGEIKTIDGNEVIELRDADNKEITGATITGEGRVVLILDIGNLVKQVLSGIIKDKCSSSLLMQDQLAPAAMGT